MLNLLERVYTLSSFRSGFWDRANGASYTQLFDLPDGNFFSLSLVLTWSWGAHYHNDIEESPSLCLSDSCLFVVKQEDNLGAK